MRVGKLYLMAYIGALAFAVSCSDGYTDLYEGNEHGDPINLLTNPSFEETTVIGSILITNPFNPAETWLSSIYTLSGWTLNLDLYDAQGVGPTIWGLLIPPRTRSGNHALIATATSSTKTQRVDITDFGLTSAMLSGTGTVIRFSEWVMAFGAVPDYYYSKLTLLDDNKETIISVNNGTEGDPKEVNSTSQWELQVLTFTNTSGYDKIRYIEVESGGKDNENWGGNYGTVFDDACLTVEY